LEHALTHNQTVFIPDTYGSSRFAPDPLWPEMHARVVVPVHLGGQIIGLLDLHRREVTHYRREELDGLELLADRLGISIRNAELYGEALDARGIAEKADRLKTVLLTNVGHELRTPLNVILGYSQTILGTLAHPGATHDAELSRYATQIDSSAEHLLRLIIGLLDLARAEIGELDLLPETLNTRRFLEAVFEASTMHFGADGLVAWQLELPPELPPLKADPVRLRQVLLNLLHNAHKCTERGQITLGAEVVPPELHLWVGDTGAGIPSDQQGQIFEPFFRDDTSARRREGIGLGLSIAWRLVALHRGRMMLESAPGRGSTFHIYLPLPAPENAPAALHLSGQRALLLITEAATPPSSLVELAERRGLRLHLLHPGDEPAEWLPEIEPALLVCDLASSKDTSWKIVEQVRVRPHLAHIPVMIYQSGPDATLRTAGAVTGLLLKSLGDSA